MTDDAGGTATPAPTFFPSPAGPRAFDARRPEKSAIDAYEQEWAPTLGTAGEARFRANGAAWAFFLSRAASCRNAATWWVVSAKKEEPRRKRVDASIADSAGRHRAAGWRR